MTDIVKVVDLKPAVYEKPVQCEMTKEEMGIEFTLLYSEYRKRKAARTGRALDNCQKSARYSIDGRHLCSQHAGRIALEILMRRD